MHKLHRMSSFRPIQLLSTHLNIFACLCDPRTDFYSRQNHYSLAAILCLFPCSSTKMYGILQDSSSSKWDDAVFIPPGFDLATGSKPSQLKQ